jgi:hypothetical protein
MREAARVGGRLYYSEDKFDTAIAARSRFWLFFGVNIRLVRSVVARLRSMGASGL